MRRACDRRCGRSVPTRGAVLFIGWLGLWAVPLRLAADEPAPRAAKGVAVPEIVEVANSLTMTVGGRQVSAVDVLKWGNQVREEQTGIVRAWIDDGRVVCGVDAVFESHRADPVAPHAGVDLADGHSPGIAPGVNRYCGDRKRPVRNSPPSQTRLAPKNPVAHEVDNCAISPGASPVPASPLTKQASVGSCAYFLDRCTATARAGELSPRLRGTVRSLPQPWTVRCSVWSPTPERTRKSCC